MFRATEKDPPTQTYIPVALERKEVTCINIFTRHLDILCGFYLGQVLSTQQQFQIQFQN